MLRDGSGLDDVDLDLGHCPQCPDLRVNSAVLSDLPPSGSIFFGKVNMPQFCMQEGSSCITQTREIRLVTAEEAGNLWSWCFLRVPSDPIFPARGRMSILLYAGRSRVFMDILDILTHNPGGVDLRKHIQPLISASAQPKNSSKYIICSLRKLHCHHVCIL